MKKLSAARFAALACAASLLFLVNIAAAAPGADEREVIVTGIGRTEDEAQVQAYRSALRSVIGSMVVSEVLVENEALIRDQVLSHSDGFVTRARQIGETRNLGDGLFEVTMQITVKSQQLQKKLQAEKITVAAMDGQSLFAKKATQDESRRDAAGIIRDQLKNLPAGVLVAEADIEGSEQKSSGSMVQLILPVKVRLDQQAFSDYVKDFQATLVTLGFKPKLLTATGGSDYTLSVTKEQFWKNLYNKPSSLENTQGKFMLGLCELVNKEAKSSRWKLYDIPKEVFSAFEESVANFALSVELHDGAGNVIAGYEVSYTMQGEHIIWQGGYERYLHFPANVLAAYSAEPYGSLAVIAPQVIFKQDDGTHFPAKVDELTFSIPFDLTEGELKEIQSVLCTISNIKSDK